MHNSLSTTVVVTLFLSSSLAWATNATALEESLPGFRTVDNLRQAGFVSLFDGRSLQGWNVQDWHEGHWTVADGTIDYDGQAQRQKGKDPNLWTNKSYGNFTLYVEWRLPTEPTMKPQPIVLYNGDFLMQVDNPTARETRLALDAGDSGILLRGLAKCQANIWCQSLGSGEINGYRTDRSLPQEIRRACIPIRKADRPLGEWNAFEITMQGEAMTVVLNGQKVIDAAQLPGVPPTGPIGLQHHGDRIQFRNIFVKTQ